MEKLTSSQSLNSEFNKKNVQNWNISVVLKTIILFFILITSQNSIAQGANNSNNIKEVNSFLSTLKANSESDYLKLNQLISGSNPAIYINDNTLKTYGENCTNLYSDVASLNYLKSNTIESNSIEIVLIKIKKTTDVNKKIDLSLFSNFSNLKYIYIISEINTTNQNIFNMIVGNTEKYSLLYKIDPAE